MSNYKMIEAEDQILRRPDWRRAFRAIQVMKADPSRTDQVFELNVALDGGDSETHFRGMLAEPNGADLMLERPDLLDRLSDFSHLETLSPDSFGAAYLNLMRGNGFAPDGLRKEAAKIEECAELHPGAARSWWAERENCVHDLLHVATGYSQDLAGETALLAFTDGMFGRQFRLRVVRFGLTASILSSPPTSLLRTIVFAWQARRRGLRSRIPFSFPWEDALERPLYRVRAQLGIAPVEVAHPRGMLRGVTETPWSLQPHEPTLSFSSLNNMG